ncbi:hypothetical protein B0H17DRAFT_1324352 [Mycena rosella]|uniref:CxC2-like cysteine cluster KDZ transposase-associated domain-containing protein n=1 Tax=Mycena rosella TaxID=1033263 RepID=A0AAD7H2W3_MYCRO|nr:hypothetical protein B0H17DRAFT_1324352 [Mycena rosella]
MPPKKRAKRDNNDSEVLLARPAQPSARSGQSRRRTTQMEEDNETILSTASTSTASNPPPPTIVPKRKRTAGVLAEDDGETMPPLGPAPDLPLPEVSDSWATTATTEPTEKFDLKKRTRPQGASVAMEKAMPHFDKAQNYILGGFAHPHLGKRCKCNADPAATIYRCEDCFKFLLYCKQCIVLAHEHNPFHRIQIWQGKLVSRISLRSLDQVIQTCLNELGANGRCKEVSDASAKSSEMILGGPQRLSQRQGDCVKVDACGCVGDRGCRAPELWEELMLVGLFPASFNSPKTVFTWRVMKQFHIHCLASKKSAYDYVKALCKLTDNTFATQIKDRYREFQFAYRIWRYLALERRTGQATAHGIDPHVPHRNAGSLTVRCPACPEVGFNITEETMKATLETEQHKFTLALSVDGNFKLQRKNKRDDPNDVALNAGAGYFAETEEYKRYVKLVKPTEDGMVDLKKGEGFANTDYALVHYLGEAMLLRWILITYDIWCQFSVHFPDRIAEWFPTIMAIIYMIEWNLNWLIYAAFTFGEMIETRWVEHNLTAGSTKEQNAGNRHDSVDDTSGNWNWDKMVGLAMALLRLYRLCQRELRKRRDNFEALSERHGKDQVAKWEVIDATPRMENGKFVSVFQTNLKNRPPTHADTYAKLLRAELNSEAETTENRTGDSGLITSALLVERDQQHVKRLIAQQTAADIPEKEALYLSSHFTKTMQGKLKLQALAQVEYALREGQAFDALAELRNAIQTLNYNLTIKKTEIHGVGKLTKAQNYLRTLSNDIQIAADTYRRTRRALLNLGLDGNTATLQELRKEDMFGKTMGHSKRVDSWFWTTGWGANLTDEQEAEWEQEMDQVKWFRDRALRDRAVEEKETLEEEFKRAILWFAKTELIWVKMGDDAEEAGSKAYAYKQAAMFHKLGGDCAKAYADAPGLAAQDRMEDEAKETAECAEADRLEAEWIAKNGGVEEDFLAYYETIEIFPKGT